LNKLWIVCFFQHRQKVEDLNARLQQIEKIVSFKSEEEFVIPNDSPLLSVIKDYQRAKVQDPDNAKNQFAQVKRMLMKDKHFQEYCKANDCYSDKTEDNEENSSEVSNLISPFKSMLLSDSQTPPSSSFYQKDSSSSLPSNPSSKSSNEMKRTTNTNKNCPVLPKSKSTVNSSELNHKNSKKIPSPKQQEPTMKKKIQKKPLSESSEDSSENEVIIFRPSKASTNRTTVSKRAPAPKKSTYKESTSSSSSKEAGSSDDSLSESEVSQPVSSSSSSSDKKSKKTKSTALRSIQVPKDKLSKDKIETPSHKILKLLNKADENELKKKLACVGPKRAQQIVKYRDKHGSFSSIDQLTQLEGIGSKWVQSFVESNQDI